MVKQRIKRGAVLIMTMMAIVLSFMLLSVLLQTTGVGQMNTRTFYDREAALQAAQSGVDYATTKLQANNGWRGDDNSEFGKLTDGLLVKEDNGNVVGLIKNSANSISAFRIKFNYEITSVDLETAKKIENNLFYNGTSFLSSALPIDMPYVSLNNFGNSDHVLMYRANDNGKGVNCEGNKVVNLELFAPQSKDKNDAPLHLRNFSNHVPAYTTCLIVEGLAGKGLRDCKAPADINDNLVFHEDAVTRRYVEVYLNQNFRAFKGYAAYAKGEINLTVRDKAFVHSGGSLYSNQKSEDDEDKSTLPNPGYMRSDNNFNVKNSRGEKGTLNAFNGIVFGKNPSFNEDKTKYTFTNNAGTEKSYTFSTEGKAKEGLNEMEELKYEDVPHTDTKDKSDEVCILPGLYEWHKSAADSNYYELRYYESGQYKVDEKTHDPKPLAGASYKLAVARGMLTEEQKNSGKYVEVAPEGKFEFVTESEASADEPAETEPGAGVTEKVKIDVTKITEPTLFLKGKLSCDGSLLVSSYKDVTDTAGFVDKCPQVIFDDYSVYNDSGEIDEEKSEPGVLTAKNDIFFIASLKGSGSAITNGGDVYFVGKSAVESGSDGVAIYGKNVNLESMDMIVDSISGNALSASMNGFKGVVDGSNVKFHPDANAMFDILKGQNNDKLKTYIEKNYGITVKTSRVDNESGGHGRHKVEKYKITVWTEGTDARKYTIIAQKNKYGYKDMWIWDHRGRGAWVYNMYFPLSAVKDGLGDEVDQMIKKFGQMAYGDQRISGAIYAQENFNVNLNGKYKLFVQGAVHARKNITAKCSGIDLDYDEMYVSKLLDTNGVLSRDLWNCW